MYPFLAILGLISFSLNAATLKESYRAALLNMESIKRAELGVEQSLAQKNLARSGLLPNVIGFGTYTRIDPPPAVGDSPFLLRRQYSTGVRVTQPLFRGGVLGALQLANENLLLSKFQKEATELNLYQLVINSYYNLKIAQTDVRNLAKLLEFSKIRVAEIRSRARIGRSRRGDLVEAEAQLHTSEAQYQQGLIELEQIEKNYVFLTRLEPAIIPDLNEVPKVEGNLSTYLAKLKVRPDIMAVRQQVKAAEHRVEIAKGAHYPSVDFVGNYYIDRTGILTNSEWDAGVVFTVPIYQGGAVDSSVREATATKRITELSAHETVRNAERELAVLFQNYLQLQSQLAATKAAFLKSEEAYKLNIKDYQYGIVTNLDVLFAMNNFIQNKRAYDSLYAIAHMTYNNLEAAVGVLP